MDRNIGKKLDGRYEITELIGIGGMADVYKAIDIIEDKIVAVKILKNEFANDDEFLRRFRNESKAIAVLSHPNIVKIFDVGFTDKIQFIVMEYIDGITLKEFMEQQGILKWKDAIHFIIQILRALQHAHDRGIVHRDIKPQNIMLFPDGTIKVMDFGIARFAREEGKTLSDKAIGSVHYISPEQARGDFTDEKSDIYSVGIMLYEMLTGRKPFDADNPVSVAVMHMQTRARNPRDLNDTIPEGLEEIVLRAIQKDASKRYQSASEMIKDIDQFKKNPSIVFEYKYLTPQPEGSTKYFKPVSSRNERIDVKKTDFEYEEEYEEDEGEERSRSGMFVPVLMGIAAAVVIMAVFFITVLVMSNINGDKNTVLNMPKLVGMNYYDAKAQYAELFKLEITEQKYSDYEQDIICEQSTQEGREIKTGTTISIAVSKGRRSVQLQNLSNMELAAAQSYLEKENLKVDVKNKVDDTTKGYVISSVPAAGESVFPGDTVILYVSLGPEQPDVIVPSFVGLTEDAAMRLANSKDLIPKWSTVDDPDIEKGTIVEQSVAEKSIVKPKTEIELKVSTGQAPELPWGLPVTIPADTSGAYVFTAYVNGQTVGSASYDNVLGMSKVEIAITGRGEQTISVEVRNKNNNKYVTLAEFAFNFTTGRSTVPTYYNYDAFTMVSDYSTTPYDTSTYQTNLSSSY